MAQHITFTCKLVLNELGVTLNERLITEEWADLVDLIRVPSKWLESHRNKHYLPQEVVTEYANINDTRVEFKTIYINRETKIRDRETELFMYDILPYIIKTPCQIYRFFDLSDVSMVDVVYPADDTLDRSKFKSWNPTEAPIEYGESEYWTRALPVLNVQNMDPFIHFSRLLEVKESKLRTGSNPISRMMRSILSFCGLQAKDKQSTAITSATMSSDDLEELRIKYQASLCSMRRVMYDTSFWVQVYCLPNRLNPQRSFKPYPSPLEMTLYDGQQGMVSPEEEIERYADRYENEYVHTVLSPAERSVIYKTDQQLRGAQLDVYTTSGQLAPQTSACARLKLDDPLSLRVGDALLIYEVDQGGHVTDVLGVGVILDSHEDKLQSVETRVFISEQELMRSAHDPELLSFYAQKAKRQKPDVHRLRATAQILNRHEINDQIKSQMSVIGGALLNQSAHAVNDSMLTMLDCPADVLFEHSNGIMIGSPEGCQVKLSSFSIAQQPITVELWRAVMGDTYAGDGSDHDPVLRNWLDSILFCNQLSVVHQLEPFYSVWYYEDSDYEFGVYGDDTATGYRLPTNAELVYAGQNQIGLRFPYIDSDQDEIIWAWRCDANTNSDGESLHWLGGVDWYKHVNNRFDLDINETFTTRLLFSELLVNNPTLTFEEVFKLYQSWGLNVGWEWCRDVSKYYRTSSDTHQINPGAEKFYDREEQILIRGFSMLRDPESKPQTFVAHCSDDENFYDRKHCLRVVKKSAP